MINFIRGILNADAARFTRYFDESQDFRNNVANYIADDAEAFRQERRNQIETMYAKADARFEWKVEEARCEQQGLTVEATKARCKRAYAIHMSKARDAMYAVRYPSTRFFSVGDSYRKPAGNTPAPWNEAQIASIKADVIARREIVWGLMTKEQEQAWLLNQCQVETSVAA